MFFFSNRIYTTITKLHTNMDLKNLQQGWQPFIIFRPDLIKKISILLYISLKIKSKTKNICMF